MKIAPVFQNLSSLSLNRSSKVQSNPFLSPGLKKDVFQKSQISFKGADDDNDGGDDFFELLAKAYVGAVTQYIMDAYFDELEAIYDELVHEGEFEAYLEVAQNADTKNAAKKINCSLSLFNTLCFSGSKADIGYINKLLNACGIDTFSQLEKFIKTFNSDKKTKEAFKGQSVEAAMIYGLLGNKTQLPRFGELLLYRFNEELGKESPESDSITSYADFLDKLKVKDLDDFREKFAHLKRKFNDLETPADISDAIDYIRLTYDKKISLLDEVLKSNPDTKKHSAEDIYANVSGIVDMFYDKNGGENLGELPDYISIAISEGKMKASAKRTFSAVFDNFESPESKIDFYGIMKDANLSIADINALSVRPIAQSADPCAFLLNFEFSTAQIAKIEPQNEKTAKATYIAFKDLVNSLYPDPDSDTTDLAGLITVISRFNIKNTQSFLDFYNKVSRTDKRLLTDDEIKEFVTLTSLPGSKEIIEKNKNKKIGPITILKEEKQNRDNAVRLIEAFLQKDPTGYFIGKTASEIYFEYKTQIDSSPQKTEELLGNIVKFGIESSNDYKRKTEKIARFEKFFNDRESLLKFVSKTGLKFDGSNDDEAYANSIFTILNDVSVSRGDATATKNLMRYYIESDFFASSKNSLSDFVKGFNYPSERTKMFRTIADKKISSVNALNRFFDTYAADRSNPKEIAKLRDFIARLPKSVSFKQAVTTLDVINQTAHDLNCPFGVNVNNIKNIDLEYFSAFGCLMSNDLNKAIIELSGDKTNKGCFVSSLPNAFETEKREHSKFRIAREIVNRVNDSDESYKNLTRVFKLDKKSLNLDENTSDYMYVRALERIIPDNFVQFVNSNDWSDYSGSGKIPNFTLHAKLRLIDRFALNDISNPKELYSTDVKNKLKGVIKDIYDEIPTDIWGTDRTKRIVFRTESTRGTLETVVLGTGEVVTVVPVE